MVIQLENSQRTSQQKQIKEIPLEFAVASIELINSMPELSSEPLYDLTEENRLKIRELIDAPFASFGGVEKYPSLEEKAAVIFCSAIRGHKFGNGNKRTAVMLLLAILYVNGKWIALKWEELYNLAMNIAKDKDSNFEKQVKETAKKLSTRITARTKP